MKYSKIFVAEIEASHDDYRNNPSAHIQLLSSDGTDAGKIMGVELPERFVFTKEEIENEPLSIHLLDELIDAYEEGKEPNGNSGFIYKITPAFILAIENAKKKILPYHTNK